MTTGSRIGRSQANTTDDLEDIAIICHALDELNRQHLLAEWCQDIVAEALRDLESMLEDICHRESEDVKDVLRKYDL